MSLSLNTAALALQPSGIRRFSSLAAATPGCISLTLGEPGEDTPAAIRAEVGRSLTAGKTHYPPNNGFPVLREAICRAMEERGLTYAPDQIIVTSGATEALFATLVTMLNPGDEVIIPTPAFVLYESIVALCRATPRPLDTTAHGYQIDGEALAACVGERTKAIVLTSPNNPTGCVLSSESLDAVTAIAAERGVYVICDDVYDRLVYTDTYQGFAQRHPEFADRTVVVNSFSKPYAMTGWRLGWLCAPQELVRHIAKVHQYAISSVVAFTQDAAVRALATDVSAMRTSYEQRREIALSYVDEMGLPVVRPEGAFYVFPDVSGLGLSSEEFCERAIREEGVALVPGTFFGGEGHVRISYACDDETLVEGLERLDRFVAGLRGHCER